nr:TSUP family transporter [uncultured Cytophaga sp.]
MDATTFYILFIIFIATLVRSTFGFGESLIAVPILSFFIPIEQAVPLSVLISIFIAAVVVIQDHKQIQYKSATGLILYAILGIPIGLLLLVYGNVSLVKIILGILIILFASYSLFSKKPLTVKFDAKIWLFICGFAS